MAHLRALAWKRVSVPTRIWLLFLTVVLYGEGHGGQWEWLLVALAALHLWLAQRLYQIAREGGGSSESHRRSMNGHRRDPEDLGEARAQSTGSPP
jgi:hypothetical protein